MSTFEDCLDMYGWDTSVLPGDNAPRAGGLWQDPYPGTSGLGAGVSATNEFLTQSWLFSGMSLLNTPYQWLERELGVGFPKARVFYSNWIYWGVIG